MEQVFFIFKDKYGVETHSSKIGSIVSKPLIPRSQRVINHISIEGRNGTLTEDTKAYNNIELPIDFINFKENLWNSEIISIFDGTGGELYLSWLDGNFIVKEVSEFSISEENRGIFKANVKFVCEPFRHLKLSNISVNSNNSKILIAGNIATDHVTTIYGNGDISLFINEEQIVFKDVSEKITINTKLLSCYKDNTSTNNKMVGEFIKYKADVNNIRWIGNVTKIDIEYRGRLLN